MATRLESNPPNPWATTSLEWLGEPPPVAVQVYRERARSILSQNESPDVPFRYSVNPYRGCQHACAYCYARPTHEYLGWGAGTDFDAKIVVKENAAELLARELARPALAGQLVAFSGVTDCYQPLEASYALTRACLEVCARMRQKVGVITKAALVRRDADLLARMAERGLARVYLSIPFADDEPARLIEPWASAPSQRFETLRRLSAAGIPTGVAIAPVIPGLNDHDIPAILARAREAGATSAFHVALRLPGSTLAVFEERLRAAFPERAAKVLAAQRDWHAGKLSEARFGARMRGSGARSELAAELFRVHARRLGFAEEPAGPRELAEPEPQEPRQGQLF